MIGTSAVNAYGAMLTGATIFDGLSHVKPARDSALSAFSPVVSCRRSSACDAENYLGSFNTFINIMVYCLVPWTAVNLMDFYVVRHGNYSVDDILDPTGRYGQWAWRGLTAYFAGFLAMIPFFNLSIYQGSVTRALGGADLLFVVGLVVSGLLYLALSKVRLAINCPTR